MTNDKNPFFYTSRSCCFYFLENRKSPSKHIPHKYYKSTYEWKMLDVVATQTVVCLPVLWKFPVRKLALTGNGLLASPSIPVPSWPWLLQPNAYTTPEEGTNANVWCLRKGTSKMSNAEG